MPITAISHSVYQNRQMFIWLSVITHQSSVSFITPKHSVRLVNKSIYMLSCPAVLDAVGWLQLGCMGMCWPSLLTAQLGCIQHHPLLAPLPPAEPSQTTPRRTKYKGLWTDTAAVATAVIRRWHARCTITSTVCFSIWSSRSLSMLAELLMSVTNHQPVPNSAEM